MAAVARAASRQFLGTGSPSWLQRRASRRALAGWVASWLLATAGMANAAIIGFEDIVVPPSNFGSLPSGYNGFDWNPIWGVSFSPFPGADSNTAHSGQQHAWGGGTELELTVHGGGRFDLASLYLASYASSGEGSYGVGSVTLTAYRSGSLVGQIVAPLEDLMIGGSYSLVSPNFINVDRVSISGEISYSNPDVSGEGNLLLDDIDATVISHGSVPEPGCWALMLLGFGALGVALRRHHTRNHQWDGKYVAA